tara:strand:+ start:456 stop:644 length:189 start_codon:yes stop_codon:yes gene_type:complete
MFNFLDKIMPAIVFLWIISLITLGVVSYYAEEEINSQRIESGRPSVPSPVREEMGRDFIGNH